MLRPVSRDLEGRDPMWKRRQRNKADIESRLSNAELSLKAIALLLSDEIVRHDELHEFVRAIHE